MASKGKILTCSKSTSSLVRVLLWVPHPVLAGFHLSTLLLAFLPRVHSGTFVIFSGDIGSWVVGNPLDLAVVSDFSCVLIDPILRKWKGFQKWKLSYPCIALGDSMLSWNSPCRLHGKNRLGEIWNYWNNLMWVASSCMNQVAWVIFRIHLKWPM